MNPFRIALRALGRAPKALCTRASRLSRARQYSRAVVRRPATRKTNAVAVPAIHPFVATMAVARPARVASMPPICANFSTASSSSDPILVDSRERLIPIDTYELVRNLRTQGFSESQSVAIVETLANVMSKSIATQNEMTPTRADVHDIEVALKEQIFNNKLRFDLSDKHLRELITSEMSHVRDDLRNLSRTNEADFATHTSDMKREVLELAKDFETKNSILKVEIEHLENRLIKYLLGLVSSLIIVCAALARLATMMK